MNLKFVLHFLKATCLGTSTYSAGSEDAQAQLQTQSSFREACCSAGVPRTGTVKHPILVGILWYDLYDPKIMRLLAVLTFCPLNHEILEFAPNIWLIITHLVMWSRCLSLRCIARAGSNQAADDEEDLHPHLCTYLTWHVKPQPYTRIPVYMSTIFYNIQGMCKNVWRRETTSKWVSPCFPAREDSGMPRDLTWGYPRKKNTMWETLCSPLRQNPINLKINLFVKKMWKM